MFLGPGFRLGARWNRLGEAVKTRKKREKTGGKWARYGLKRVNTGRDRRDQLEDEQDGAGVLPSREQLQAYLSEMLLSPTDGEEEEVDRDLPQYASLEECAEALKQCGIGLRSAHQQLFPAAV